MVNLRDHNTWNQINGTLSVGMLPQVDYRDDGLHVLMNGGTGNFCLDYVDENFDANIAKRRAWSADTGYYVKITPNDKVFITRWWDDYQEDIPLKLVEEKLKKFYNVISKNVPNTTENIVSFAKQIFINLRNCVNQEDNGINSLRTFMYLLAALEEGIETPLQVKRNKWLLPEFDSNWIAPHDWEFIYNSFKSGLNNKIQPLVQLVLRHASNRLFQEAHREATRSYYQTAFWGGTNRKYDSPIQHGAFYTPTPLVRTIVKEVIWALNKVKSLQERKALRVLDPACGSAEFLREFLRQLKINNYNGDIFITGWDISEIACEMSRFVLNYENLSEWNGNVKITIKQKDSLIYNWLEEDKQDAVLLNPPFQAYENQGERKIIVIQQLEGLAKRQPDMAAVFWKKAAEITASEGSIGIILPHSLLSASTYKNLRSYIKEELNIDFSLIAHLGSAGLFEKAMIIPAILVGVKSKKINQNTILWTSYDPESVYKAFRELRIYRNKIIPIPISEKKFSIYTDRRLTSKNNWTVNSYQLNELEKKLIDFSKVGNLFKVARGADSGNNSAFLLKKDDWLQLPKSEQKYFRPCIMRDSIVNGQLHDVYYMFYPYGDHIIYSEKELQQNINKYYSNYLLPQKNRLKVRRGRKEKWWELNEHRPWQVNPKPKLISSYFGKAGYFAFDQNGKYLVGQSFAWLPKKIELNNKEYYLAYLAILHAPLINKLLEMVCNVLHGGYFDLSKHYVDKMPLPDLTKANPEIMKDLSKFGREIHDGNSTNKKKLNEITAISYGIDLKDIQFD